MAKNWDAEMQARFEKLAQTVDDFRGRFEAIDHRFDTVDKRFGVVDGRFDHLEKQMEAMEKRILEAFKIQGEDLRGAIQKAAEGYGATLQSIERKLDEANRHWAAKWELHEDVLKNHAGRIAALEDRRER